MKKTTIAVISILLCLGILAIVLFWNKIFPFDLNKKPHVKKDVFTLWFKILVACIPAAVIGETINSNDKIVINGEETRFLEPAKPDEIFKIKWGN